MFTKDGPFLRRPREKTATCSSPRRNPLPSSPLPALVRAPRPLSPRVGRILVPSRRSKKPKPKNQSAPDLDQKMRARALRRRADLMCSKRRTGPSPDNVATRKSRGRATPFFGSDFCSTGSDGPVRPVVERLQDFDAPGPAVHPQAEVVSRRLVEQNALFVLLLALQEAGRTAADAQERGATNGRRLFFLWLFGVSDRRRCGARKIKALPP